MCDCINQVNEQLRKCDTELDVTITYPPHVSVRARVATYIPYKYGTKTKRGQKPAQMTATYCPFCGKKYED